MRRLKMPTNSVYTIVNLLKQRKICLRPPYQRRLVWTYKEKQRLIDSILRGFDIGKIYFWEVQNQPYEYAVIDGQQRLHTLMEFMENKLQCLPIQGLEVADKTFEQLPTQLQHEIGSYQLDIEVVRDAKEEEIRDMFRRLQLGKVLTTGERLKAYYGKFHNFLEQEVLKRRIIDQGDVFERELFKGYLLGFKNKRDVYYEAASQMVRLSFEERACSLRRKDLENMYDQYRDQIDETKKREALRDLEFFEKVLEADGGTFHPDKANSVSLFLFVSHLRRNYAADPETIIKFIKKLEGERHSQSLTDPELIEYNKQLYGGSASKKSIEFRFDTLIKRFLAENPGIRLLDDRRTLRKEQRMAVYWRDKGICKICGTQVSDREFEIHHIEAWHKGGPTTVENSLTLCKSCHQKVTRGELKL